MAIKEKELHTDVTQKVRETVVREAQKTVPVKGFYAKIPEDMHTAFNKKALFEDDNVKNASDAVRQLIQKYLDGEITLG